MAEYLHPAQLAEKVHVTLTKLAVAYPGPEGANEAHAAVRELVRLAGERDALGEILAEIQWSGSAWIGMQTCPMCGNEKDEGHISECLVAAALERIGQEDAPQSSEPVGADAPTSSEESGSVEDREGKPDGGASEGASTPTGTRGPVAPPGAPASKEQAP